MTNKACKYKDEGDSSNMKAMKLNQIHDSYSFREKYYIHQARKKFDSHQAS